MKLPNDLIKSTDFEKAKDRIIHEFECRNGKFIHRYVLGGEHELTNQEIVDCLNGLATIDCDLQTAYAYIKGQKEKITNLEAKLAESEKALEAKETINNMYKATLSLKDGDFSDLVRENARLKNELEKYKIKDTVGLAQFINKNSVKLAITELEKTKEFMWTWLDQNKDDFDKLNKFIDNQIKSLKERKHE